jgi:serine phosphatase RsbU (regulator of sigma subunit)
MALSVTTVIVAVDVGLGGDVTVGGLLAMVPFMAALFCGPGTTLLVAILALAVGFGLGAHDGQMLVPAQFARLGGIAFAGLAATVGAAVRVRRVRRLLALQAVVDVTQQTVLRPLPPRIHDVLLAVRYLSAATAAQVGGDMYDATDTPFGVRLLIGDVRGKGLSAVYLASVVLSAFREAAPTEPDIAKVAARIDASLRRHADDEDFVTALIVEVTEPGTATVLACGHHPPVLISGDRVWFADFDDPGLPLGLGESWQATVVPFAAGDRMLLYTDGIAEARGRRNREFPLLDRARDSLTTDGPERSLQKLLRRLRRHVRGRLDDDVAIMFVERT